MVGKAELIAKLIAAVAGAPLDAEPKAQIAYKSYVAHALLEHCRDEMTAEQILSARDLLKKAFHRHLDS